MKSTVKRISLLCMIAIAIIGTGCQEDTVIDDPTSGFEEFTAEVFDDLTVEQFATIETPFESLVTAVAGGRQVASDALVEALIAIIEGAVLLEVVDGEERGLSVYKVKFLLSNGAVIEVVVVKEIFEILEIEGHSGPFDYNIDPEESFISLEEAFAIAQSNIEGEIARWELELEEDNNWEYEIHVENANGRFEVEVNAFTGDLIGIKTMDEQADDEFEDEETEDVLPENILNILPSIIDATVLYAEKEETDRGIFWHVLVETASGAKVYLVLTDDTEDLISAADEEGPFDYELTIGDGFLKLQEVLEMVELELQAQTYYWYYESVEHDGEERWAFVVKVIDAAGAYYRVTVDAISGEWLTVEDHTGGDNVELPENIAAAVASMIEGEVLHAEKIEEGDRAVWVIYVKTASGAEVGLVIKDDTQDIIEAYGELGPFDYDLNIGQEFVSLQTVLSEWENQFAAETLYWIFGSVEIEGVAHWAFIIEIEGVNGKFRLTIDAISGDLLEEEIIN